jgi:serine O-acetyltransferase
MLGLDKALAEYRSILTWAIDKVRWENRYVRCRFHRTEAGVPIFNPMHVDHLVRMTHNLAFGIWRSDPSANMVLDSLFFVMRSRFNMNLFYRARANDFFLPKHGIGTVLGYGDWGRFLIVTQGCTIGHNKGLYPTIGDGLFMAPNATILGACTIGRNVTIASGARVVDTDVPDNTVVFGQGADLVFKPNTKDNIDLNFYLDELKADLTAAGIDLAKTPPLSLPAPLEFSV